jgi:hypothetical protein
MAKELTIQEQRELLTNPVVQTVKMFETQQRMAQMYATSGIVPKQYVNNIGGCVIAIDMAMRMKVNPLMVMQNLFTVNGSPSWSSKFLISCVNTCGRFTPLRYEFKGEPGTPEYGCRAYAYEKSDVAKKEKLYGPWVTWEMVTKEGWHIKRDRNGNDTKTSKWLSMADLMFNYRAAAFWARIYAPEISMGFNTIEEVEEAEYTEIPIVEDQAEEVKDATDTKEEKPAEPEAQPKEEVKQQPASKPATPADAIKQAIKKQTANQPAADKPGERQEGNLFDQQ